MDSGRKGTGTLSQVVDERRRTRSGRSERRTLGGTNVPVGQGKEPAYTSGRRGHGTWFQESEERTVVRSECVYGFLVSQNMPKSSLVASHPAASTRGVERQQGLRYPSERVNSSKTVLERERRSQEHKEQGSLGRESHKSAKMGQGTRYGPGTHRELRRRSGDEFYSSSSVESRFARGYTEKRPRTALEVHDLHERRRESHKRCGSKSYLLEHKERRPEGWRSHKSVHWSDEDEFIDADCQHTSS